MTQDATRLACHMLRSVVFTESGRRCPTIATHFDRFPLPQRPSRVRLRPFAGPGFDTPDALS